MKEQFKIVATYTRRFSKEIIVALILALIAAGVIEWAKERARGKAIANNLKATALIMNSNTDEKSFTQGSGFFIDSSGTFVTSYHVIEGTNFKGLIAKLPSGAFYMVKDVIGIDKPSDIALIKFDAKETPFVQLGNSDEVHHGDEIVVISAPKGLDCSVSTGVISNPKRDLGGISFIQFTAPISPGSSGGGLFNKSGQIIGVVAATMATAENQNLNFAVAISRVKEALKGEEKNFSVDSPEFLYSKGVIAQNKREYDKAVDYFKRAISIDDKYVQAYLDLGLVYDEKSMYDEELTVLKKAVQLDPNNSDAHYYLAWAYENEGLFDNAISAYERVLKIRPSEKDALYELGILYIVQGQSNKAAALVPRLATLNPGTCNELRKLLMRVK